MARNTDASEPVVQVRLSAHVEVEVPAALPNASDKAAEELRVLLEQHGYQARIERH